MAGGRTHTAGRLFGNAVAGVKGAKIRKTPALGIRNGPLKGSSRALAGCGTRAATVPALAHHVTRARTSVTVWPRQHMRDTGHGGSSSIGASSSVCRMGVGSRVRGRGPRLFSHATMGARRTAADEEAAATAAPPPVAVTPPTSSGVPVRRVPEPRCAAPYFNSARQPPLLQHDSREAERRWQHDQFDGPQTVGSAVFVRNLPRGATAQQLGSLFSTVGQVVSVQVDMGPLPTATIGFVRQDAALQAERRYHRQWLQGSQLKVSVKEASSSHINGEDEEFWRRELRSMPKRGRQITYENDIPDPAEEKYRKRAAFVAHDHRRVSIFDRLS